MDVFVACMLCACAGLLRLLRVADGSPGTALTTFEPAVCDVRAVDAAACDVE